MSWAKEVEEINKRKALAKGQGGEEATARQHEKGRLTIRERIDGLLDKGSFRETGPISGASELDDDGALQSFTPGNFVLGTGKMDGRPCVVGGEDFTLRGGSPNVAGLRKSIYAEEWACHLRVPLVRLHEGGGGSVTGAGGKGGGGPTSDPVYAVPRFASVARALGMVPVAAGAMGPVPMGARRARRLSWCGISGASVATTTMIELPPPAGSSPTSGSRSAISRPTGTPATVRFRRSP